ncbi:MAG: RNA methyltransferase [Acidobacteria bacterium]|nr:RNA methyltransferase [Acidobacteriota bacterium]
MSSSVSRIESRQNPQYKLWKKYVAHPEKEDCPWISIEGWKQIQDLSAQHPIELLLFSKGVERGIKDLLPRSTESFQLAPALFESLSTLDSSQQILAFFEKPSWNWKDLTSRVLYLNELQDPGNLGTLLRTARATGIFSVATSPHTVSCFNAKVVRASAASLFSVPFLEGIEAGELKSRGYHLWATTPQGGKSLFEAHFESPLAIVIGNEGRGLSPAVLGLADHHLHIPMQPQVESLNAAVAGSLVLYEVFRQGTI